MYNFSSLVLVNVDQTLTSVKIFNITVLFQPGQEFILPGCKEKVTCYVKEDGSSDLVHSEFNLQPNTVCNSDIPPRVECAQGFSRQGTSDQCIRKSTNLLFSKISS